MGQRSERIVRFQDYILAHWLVTLTEMTKQHGLGFVVDCGIAERQQSQVVGGTLRADRTSQQLRHFSQGRNETQD